MIVLPYTEMKCGLQVEYRKANRSIELWDYRQLMKLDLKDLKEVG